MAFLAREGIAAARVVPYGESLGTGVAVHFAATHAVAALVLESPYTSIAAVAGGRYPIYPVQLMVRDPYDSLSRIAKVRAALLVLQGDRDVVVPPRLGKALFAAAHEPKEMWTSPAAGHNDIWEHGAADVVLRFIAQRTATSP